MQAITSRRAAEDICRGKDLYSCEILFDDWEKIDDVLNDKDVHIVFCARVFKRVEDRRHLCDLITHKDEKEYHFPVVRLIFITSSKTLYENVYRTIGIDYRQLYWFSFSYKDFVDAKERNIPRAHWFHRLRCHLLDKYRATNDPELWKVIRDDDYWKYHEACLETEDKMNGIFGVRMSPNWDSSQMNLSKFKKI